MRIPFDELGGKCVFSSEYDKFAQQTYEANFGEKPHGDITKPENFDSVPEHDLLLAGFPCQAFSYAGLIKGFGDTRGTMFFSIVSILKKHRPKAFLLENVKALATHDSKQTIKTIKYELEGIGYVPNIQVLNARDFGLPQNRERIFIVGIKDKPSAYQFPKPLNIKTRLGKILQKRVKDKYTISDRLWKSHQERKQRYRDSGRGFGYSLFNRDSTYSSTISARYYKDGSEILIEQKGKNPRMLTPREAARLQGFPEDFVIPVSNNQAYKQFGNAVPINVIRELAKEMEKFLI